MNSEQSLNSVSQNLTKLTNKELLATKWALEKFFYRAGKNVALYNATRSKKYKYFEGSVEDAIRAMLLKIAREDYLKDITLDLRKASDQDLVARVGRVFSSLGLSIGNFIKGGEKGVQDFLVWAGGLGGQAAFDKWQIDITFDVTNPLLVEALKDRSIYLINSVDNTTKKWLADLISAAKAERLTNAEIADLIKQAAPEISSMRAGLIAETEVAHAMGYVEMQTSLNNGVEKWKWITSEDDRVDGVCLANEAVGFIKVGDNFPSGNLHEPAHPRCRCYMKEDIPVEFNYDGRRYWVGEGGEVFSVPSL